MRPLSVPDGPIFSFLSILIRYGQISKQCPKAESHKLAKNTFAIRILKDRVHFRQFSACDVPDQGYAKDKISGFSSTPFNSDAISNGSLQKYQPFDGVAPD